MNNAYNMKSKWQGYLKERSNKQILFFTVFSLAIVLFAFLHFLTYNESRSGSEFDDPILKNLTPQDLSGITFLLTYSVALTGIIISLKEPRIFIVLLQAYLILTLLRILSLYLIPLAPPPGIIILNDKLLRFSFYSGRDNLKDLFFSGHTATIFLFAFIFNDKRLKWIFSIAAILIGFLLMKQHVHYSIDILFAPVFAWLAIILQKKISLLNKK
jgi:membrane-associated phospholipid phosphatase